MGKLETRKKPIQDRGHKRLKQLLKAATELIAEEGVDHLTTNAISARAETSVGQLYKYFLNKEAVVEELSKQYGNELEIILHQREKEGVSNRSLIEAIEWTILSLVKFHERNPAFRHIYRHQKAKGHDYGSTLLDKSKRIIDKLLEIRSPSVESDSRFMHSVIVVESAHELIIYATSLKNNSQKKQVIQEIIQLIFRYLNPIYGSK